MEQCCIADKQWTAPEILRENFPPVKGTQKGDVYSYAIIMYEIMQRSEPYTFDTMTPKGQYPVQLLTVLQYCTKLCFSRIEQDLYLLP